MVNFSININKTDATQMWNDILKFLTVAVVVHILLYFVDDYGDIFDEKSLKIFLYITIGLVLYYLFIKNLSINIIDTNNKQQNQQNKQNVKKSKYKKNKKVRFQTNE
jgi:hypothetical protein